MIRPPALADRTNSAPRRLVVSSFACLLVLGAIAITASAARGQSPASSRSAGPGLVENLGQWPDDVLFAYHAPGQIVWFTRDGYVVDRFTESPLDLGELRRGGAIKDAVMRGERRVRGVVVAARLVEANPSPSVEARNARPGRFNYFIGDEPSSWRPNVASYSEVSYRDVYPGIDVVYRFDDDAGLKYDVVVAPGADLGDFAIRYAGADGVAIGADGHLRIATAEGEFVEERPFIYQEIAGRRVPVAGAYALRADGCLAFDVPAYDRSLPLVVDPRLSWSTMIGGAGIDCPLFMAGDASGNSVLVGFTRSPGYPTTVGAYDRTANGNEEAFVSKFDAMGGLVFSTFLGGSGADYGHTVALDAEGRAIVGGYAGGGSFPTTVGAYDRTYGGGTYDGFALKLAADGASLVYSTFFGGSGTDVITGVAESAAGDLILAGMTESSNLPSTPNAFDPTFNGYIDGFIAKLDGGATSLLHATFLGAPSEDLLLAAALGAGDKLIVGGMTQSLDFPTSSMAYDTSHNGIQDGFLALFDLDQEALGFSTFIGGEGFEYAYAVGVDEAGRPMLGGETASGDFPVTPGAFDQWVTGGTDAFLTKLDANGRSLVFSTLLGGEGFDYVQNIATLSDGSVLTSGATLSPDFPVTGGTFRGTAYAGGLADGFVAVIGKQGKSLTYSTCLGGSDGDASFGVVLGPGSRVMTCGYTASTDFPTTVGAYDRTHNGSLDAFLSSMTIVFGGMAEKRAGEPSAVSAPAPALALSVESPARGAIAARVTMPRGGAAMLELVDTSGRRVLERRFQALPAGPSAVAIDAAAARAVAAGVYLLRVATDDGTASAKVTLVR